MASLNEATHRSTTSCVIYYIRCGAQKLVNKNYGTRHEARYAWHEDEHGMSFRR